MHHYCFAGTKQDINVITLVFKTWNGLYLLFYTNCYKYFMRYNSRITVNILYKIDKISKD